jgi:hypothetical protein
MKYQKISPKQLSPENLRKSPEKVFMTHLVKNNPSLMDDNSSMEDVDIRKHSPQPQVMRKENSSLFGRNQQDIDMQIKVRN